MGNEMGNNNVSGLQENENDKFEAPRKSSEVHITMSGDDNVNAEDKPVSSSKEDFHESGENLLSGNTSLIGDSRTGMEVSARTDADNLEEQEPGGFSNDLLKFNGKETETFSSSENGLVDQLHSASERISVSTVHELIEPENVEVQATIETNEIQGDGSPKQLVSDNTNDEGTCSVVSTEGGRYYEADSVSENNLSKTSSDQIQEQLSTPTDPAESSAVFASNGPEHEINKSVSSPTNGYFNETSSASKEDKLETGDQKVQKQTTMEREDEELMNLSPNTTPTSESIDSITLSEELKPDNLDAEPFGKDGMILKRCDRGTLGLSEDIKEKEKLFANEKTDVVDGSLRHITSSEVGKLRDDTQIEEINFEEDTLVHKESEPFNSSEDRYADEIDSTSEKNPAQASDSRTQDHTEGEELMNLSPNTTPTSGSVKSINLSEELKPDNLDAESFGKDGMILKKIDERTLGLSGPHEIEEKEEVFENETTDAVDGSLQHITSSEVEKLKDGMQIEEIKTEEDILVYEESEPFTSSKDGFVDEIASTSEKNLAQTSDSRIQDHIEPETTEVQVLHGSPRTQLMLNDSKDEGTLPVLSSEGESFDTTTTAFDENLPKTSDDLRERSTKTDDAESSVEFTSNELKDEDTQSALSPEDGCSVEIITAAQENVLETTDHKDHKETLNGKDDVESSIELMRHDLNDEDTQSASSAGDGCSVEIVTAAEENVLETIDHKVHKETLNGKEGEELMNLSPKTSLNQLDSELTESILNDQLKLDSVGAEPYKEDGEILQGMDQATLENSGPHDTEKENELEYERQHAQDEGALPIHNSDAEKLGDGMQREEIKSLDNALLDNSKAEEMLRIKTGVHVEEALKTGLGLNEQQSLGMELDRKLSMDSQLKVVPLVRLPEVLQVENTKSEDKFVVLTDNTILFENGNGVEHNKESTNFISHSESEETKVDKFASAESSSSEVVVKALANEGEARTYLGKDVEETEIVNPVSFHSDSNEPGRTYSVHLVQNESTDADQNLTAIAPNMVVNGINSNTELKKEKSIEADAHKSSTLHARLSTLMELATLGISRDQCQIQENISKASDSTCGHESKMKLASSDSKEGYTTSNEQKNLSPTVDAHIKSSFHVDSQIADIFVIERQQAEEMNKKEADKVFTTSTVEDKHDFGRFSTETFSADANIDGEVPTNGRGEVPDQSPPKYEEKTINSEVLKPNCYVSDVSTNQTGVGTGSPCTETNFSVNKEVKEYLVEKSSQDQTTEEKKLLASGRISTEKLNMPLLSYLKEESAGSQHKQEKLVAKKATKNKRSSHDDKHSGSTTQGREKRKPKPLFFGICMCCTAEIL